MKRNILGTLREDEVVRACLSSRGIQERARMVKHFPQAAGSLRGFTQL